MTIDHPQTQVSILSAALRHKRLVGICGLAGLLLALLYSVVRPRPPEFAAIATVGIQEPGTGESGPFAPSERYVGSQAAIIRSNAVAEQAAELLQESQGPEAMTSVELQTQTSVGTTPSSNLLVIRTNSDTSENAIAGVNAIVTAYDDFTRQQYTRTATAALDRLDAQLASLEERFAAIQAEIEGLVSQNEVSAQLDQVYNSAVMETALLLSELTTASQARRAEIEERLDVLLQQIETYRLLVSSGPQDPQHAALLEEQNQIIQRRAVLLERRDQITIDAELAPTPIAIVSLARSATAVSGADFGRFAAAGLLAGLAAGVGIGYIRATSRRVFTSPNEVESILAAPLLADIPNFDAENLDTSLPVRDAPRSAAAEAYRFAAASIERKAQLEGSRSLIAVTALVGHGKTTTVVNIALANARQGIRVLVIDADFGNQGASSLLVGESLSHRGLTDVLDGQASMAEAVQRVNVGSSNSVYLVGRGLRPVVAAEMLRTRAAGAFFEASKQDFDLVLIDAPPLLQVAYTSTLVGYADAAMVIVPHGSAAAPLAELRSRLSVLRTPIFGFVYNQSPLRPEMAATEGSMRDILGDRGLVAEAPSRMASKSQLRK